MAWYTSVLQRLHNEILIPLILPTLVNTSAHKSSIFVNFNRHHTLFHKLCTNGDAVNRTIFITKPLLFLHRTAT
jgi:hypothetical protein